MAGVLIALILATRQKLFVSCTKIASKDATLGFVAIQAAAKARGLHAFAKL